MALLPVRLPRAVTPSALWCGVHAGAECRAGCERRADQQGSCQTARNLGHHDADPRRREAFPFFLAQLRTRGIRAKNASMAITSAMITHTTFGRPHKVSCSRL